MKHRMSRWADPLPGSGPPTPVTHIDLYPTPLPPPSPSLTREENLARVQSGFASLDEAELRVALLWLTGLTFDDLCVRAGMRDDLVRKVWSQMRRKLRDGVKGNA